MIRIKLYAIAKKCVQIVQVKIIRDETTELIVEYQHRGFIACKL